jgi:hypothetical protein
MLLPGLFPGPLELSAVNPYAVHDHGQPAIFLAAATILCARAGGMSPNGAEGGAPYPRR